jgi:glycosyltransferase involved in cell wall biosynthesis
VISLIVATINRVTELEQLFDSLDRQSYKNFEVLLVDQNPDDRLLAVVNHYKGLAIQRYRSGRGLSRARNVALPHVQGDIVAFPDDDCWYPDDLLATVAAWFDSHPDFAGLLATLRDADGTPVGPRWPPNSRLCTKEDIFLYAISPNGFLRRSVVDAIGPFNESLGIGAATTYQSGEDFDYFLRPLALGMKIGYEPSITVHHPSFQSLSRLMQKSYSYSLGGAYVMRQHGFSPAYFAGRVTRSLGGAVVSLCKGNMRMAYSYLLRTAGQLRGYFCGARDLQRQAESAGN